MSDRFKTGQSIYCIENTVYKEEISVGGIYTVLDYIKKVTNEVYLLNDQGERNFYPKEYFCALNKKRGEIIDYIMMDEG